ncbi:MAG: zinc-dependent alcohol dehydrogenase family protein [bacterium]|nr:zinc-dependent alcohol dehydrogenase family protein [bacterium]
MRAIVITEFGPPHVFAQADVPTPTPGPGQILIRVAASSVNPLDYKIRSGLLPSLAPPFPAVLHGDVAGVVEACGPGVSTFHPGDRVFACAGGIVGHGGALAEFMLADANLVAHAPRSLPLTHAAVLPLVSLTAWEALIDRVHIKPAQRVLIHGGTGGVGHIALQLAKLQGAFLYTTVSSDEKAAAARSLGANTVINYKTTPVDAYVAEHTNHLGFDLVFDTVGGPALTASFSAVKAGGSVVTIAARSTQDLSPLHAKGASLHVVLMLLPMLTGINRPHHGAILRSIADLVDTGRLRPLIHPRVFSFLEVAEAHATLERGGVIGKIALSSPWFNPEPV